MLKKKIVPRSEPIRSAGAVVYHGGEKIEYLLLLSRFWGFPKGHIEAGEDERTAALREVREETGLSVELIPGFRAVDDYRFSRQGSSVNKRAIFFLARAPHRNSKISWEHEEMAWLAFDEAMEYLRYPRLRAILQEADEFLKRSNG